jgi:hypothetical protein
MTDPATSESSSKVVPLVAGGAFVVVVIVAVVMAIGLRGGTASENADGLVDHVEIFTTVYLSSGSPDRAYDHWSSACRDQVGFDEFEQRVVASREALEEELGIDLGRLAVAEVDTRAVADGRGQAEVSLEEIGLDEIPVDDVFVATGWSDWVYEAGLWRAADCDRPGDLISATPGG